MKSLQEVPEESKAESEIQKPFVCGTEAAALLNCVADANYNEHKCLPLLRKLRDCIKKHKVARFDLITESDPSSNGTRVALVTGVGIGVFLTLGRYVMYATNPELKEDKSFENERMRIIKAQQSERSKLTTDRNRQSLEQFLEELQNHSDEERYQTALREDSRLQKAATQIKRMMMKE